MKLLLRRDQGYSGWQGRRPCFKLWARFDLTAEERGLIDQYRVQDTILSDGDPERDLKRSAKWAIAGGLVAMPVAMGILGTGLVGSFVVGLLVFGGLTYLIYQQIREEIRVSDILAGRFFRCTSVLTLVAKEETITHMAVLFRQFLETMKTWGGEDIIAIELQRKPLLHLEPTQHAAA